MDKPEWLRIGLDELDRGVEEIPGDEHNPDIIKYHSYTTLKATKDEVSWCSSFACYCMEVANVPSTRSARARDWEKWGKELKDPVIGCVVVFWRVSPESGSGHVGFYMGETNEGVMILGGNQGNAVSIIEYPKSQFLSYRWPDDRVNS